MKQAHPNIEQIVEYLHGELSPAEDAAVHAHLAGCSYCEQRRAEEAALTEALRAHARARERELPLTVVSRIRQRVAQPSAPSPWEAVRAAFRPILVLPVAVAVAAILYFGGQRFHRLGVPPAIDASDYIENHAAMASTTPFADSEPSPILLTSADETH
jgi:anti-sigma factor RsiW